MKYYPIHINIKNKRCLIVGGDKVAERKIKKLYLAGAAITVISKELTPALLQMKDLKQFIHLNRHYQTDDVCGFFLVFAATNKQLLNQQITDEAKVHNVLSNSLNGVDQGDFILPATCGVGHLKLGVTTEGKSPALSAKLRRYLIKKLSSVSEEMIGEIAEKRAEMVENKSESAKKEMELIVDELIKKIENNKVDLGEI
ncbi:MAG: bifunctional precorrin-2 dehydrogenase/sirohydrochlorin ferrochelatase [Carboxylicivirga sp.]|nr:bifunctional precorrin-2 dehydrogenase/sirohydrochlorin ferrochelatase [Carboxylicivirga sp.]